MQQRKPSGVLNGWPFVGVAAVAILASIAVAIAITPDVGEAAGRAVRLTARTSVALFLAAFTASALFRLWPNAWTRWQRSNRRFLGVAFAVSHGVHLVAIFWLQHVQPVDFAQEVNAIIWLIFANSYVGRALAMPEYIPAAALVVLALGLRIAARVARPRASQPVTVN